MKYYSSKMDEVEAVEQKNYIQSPEAGTGPPTYLKFLKKSFPQTILTIRAQNSQLKKDMSALLSGPPLVNSNNHREN